MSCSDGAASYNFTVARNGFLDRSISLLANGVAVDLTGWSAAMQLRDLPETAPVRLEIVSGAPTANQSRIIFTDPVNGLFELFITNADLLTLPAPSPVYDPISFAYDLVLITPDDNPQPYMRGAFTVLAGVTQ